MRSLILRKVSQGLLPILVLFSLYLLLRGHNEPGGGFISGLVGAAAIVILALAFGVEWSRSRLHRILRPSFALGIAIAVLSGLIPVFVGDPFLMHYHWHIPLPGDGYYHLSTTLLFDIGVYMVVVGSTVIATSVFAEGIA